jgi:hypothetical protein
MVRRAQQMSTDPKQVLDDAVNGREAWQLGDRRASAVSIAMSEYRRGAPRSPEDSGRQPFIASADSQTVTFPR